MPSREMWAQAGTWRAFVALTLVVAAGIAGVVVLGNRVEDARTQSRLLSSLYIDAQRLHVAALGAALDDEVGPAEQRGIHSARTGMVQAIRGLRGWPDEEMSLLRTRNRQFYAAVASELSAIGGDEPTKLHRAALSTALRFTKLERVSLRMQKQADDRYDAARRQRDAVVLALVALALLASGGFALRLSAARRDRAELLHRENDRLVELDRMKEEFVASVSHELRTPLTSIRGYLELVLEADPTPEQAEYLSVIDRNADRLLDLINDLLDVAQAENGRLVLNLEPVDLASIVTDAVAGQRPSAVARKIELGLDVEEQEARVSADRKRIGQVVDNLLSNALKFTPDGGSVDVRLVRQNGHARLDVSDTGIGIPEAEQARLFERFFRTEAASGQAFQGTGLGLAISKAIVEAHGGQIAVTSAEGLGTTFSVLLPR
jgi:signal transduction histidine kinase